MQLVCVGHAGHCSGHKRRWGHLCDGLHASNGWTIAQSGSRRHLGGQQVCPPCSSPRARSNFSLSTWPRAAWTERVVGMGGRADALRTHHALLTGDGAAQSGHAGTDVQAAVCPGWHCAGFFLCTVPAVGASAGTSLLFPAQHCSPSTPASTVTFVQHADQCLRKSSCGRLTEHSRAS